MIPPLDSGLDERALSLLSDVFTRHQEVTQVKVFGSRALGTYRPESDVDIALYGTVNAEVTARIKGELEELPLPFTFDVLAYACITHQALIQHIDKAGRLLFSRV